MLILMALRVPIGVAMGIAGVAGFGVLTGLQPGLNLLANVLFTAHVAWALLPLGVFAFGWAMMVPVVTLLVLDLHPDRRGMASSVQSCLASLANAAVAGVLVPLVMHSTLALAVTSLALMGIGLVAWIWVKPRLEAQPA